MLKKLLLVTGLLVSLAIAGCGDDDDDGATTAPTATQAGTQSSGGSTSGAISEFPADVQPLLEGLPDEVVQALLDVRNDGPGTLVFHDSGGEQDAGFARAFRDNWE